MRMRRPRAPSSQSFEPESPRGSDGDNPVMPEVERQFLVQTIDQRRPVLVQERDEAYRPLLSVPAREGERPRVDELPAEGFVAALRRLNHLAVQRLEIALHPLERRARGAFQRRI